MAQWEVVGGADKGGILVRDGQELTSKALDSRLSHGSVVEELKLAGDRLHYRLVDGSGPQEGWVSVKISGGILLTKKEGTTSAVEVEKKLPSGFGLANGDSQKDPSYPSMAPGKADTGKSPWLKTLGKAKADAKARLIIFSWTGNRGGQGSAHNFLKPASPAFNELLQSFELYEVTYPGRGTRMKDNMYQDPSKYTEDIAAALEVALSGGKPFAFLGFSFGSILAFEVARCLQKKSIGPLCVAVASAEAPSWDGRAKLGFSKLGEAAFEKMLKDKGGTDFILNDPGMKAMFVPVISSDCRLEENYGYDASKGLLECPILAFVGSKVGHDKMKTMIELKDAEPWLEVSSCKALSDFKALDSDWYIFQDAGATETVAKAISDFCNPRF
eukprot:TRINITY_DN6197_c0_g1_i1.p1 TRINITY_DN6197_c0_g1~~TRINITY_DN6197_c0_g1_i1.p1  ORF type:complete len:386 (-),score=80.64 TRINITY_DN6197_c0_g1_i1:103-1260(-)